MAPGPEGAALQRQDSFQYPAGHINHLNENQLRTLDEFKELSQEKGYWVPASAKSPASHDDETLLRYLRARKFVPSEAFKQFKDTEDWRQENQIDRLYETIDIEEYDQSRRLYPQWLGRRDKRGIPVYLFEIAHLDNKAIAAYQSNTDSKLQTTNSKVPVKMLRLFALYENLCRFVLPLCSAMPDRQHPETPISQSSNIVDISGVSLMQFWKLKNHMQDASILATAHYPETLDRIFLLGAPGFFPTVWSWVKRWFDPITVSKIFVLSQKETLPTLLKFIDIENIPKKYGGKLDFKFGDLPSIDEGISSQLNWKEPGKPGVNRSIPTGPIKWQYGENGDLEAVAAGTVNGVQRNKVIFSVHPDSNIAQMPLSPGRVQTAEGAKTAINNPAVAAQSTTNNPVMTTQPGTNGSATAQPEKQAVGNAESSITAVSDIPFRDNTTQAADKMPDVREGTSSTRYEQQAHTHAHGNVAEGTPAIARDGQGEKQAIMEPATVGQAPKEHPVPEPQEQPTMIEQARHTAEAALQSASDASQSVLAAVGLGRKKVEEPVKEDKHDPAIDNMEGKKVEEMLRAKTMSQPQA